MCVCVCVPVDSIQINGRSLLKYGASKLSERQAEADLLNMAAVILCVSLSAGMRQCTCSYLRWSQRLG